MVQVSSSPIRFAWTTDRVRLAWTVSGHGSALVKAPNWLTHLEYDWQSPVWKHWTIFLSENFRYFRFDERGNGLSDHKVEDVSSARWSSDLETIIKAAKPDKPFALLGISQGACAAIKYAAQHPDDVSDLIIYGGYTRGWARRNDAEERRRREAIVTLAETGWGRPDPVFRRLYTSMFLPKGTEEELHWYDELCARTTTPRVASRLMLAQGDADYYRYLSDVAVPTLVMHARGDAIVPFSEGVEIASNIREAEFVPLDSDNHILLSSEPAWDHFKQAVLEFVGQEPMEEDAVFEKLSVRERQVLSKITEGMTNRDIGNALFISEKTVRNHVTNIMEKLGVSNRAQAIAFARDRKFKGRT